MICFQDFAPLKNLVVKFEADEYVKELPIFINETKTEGIKLKSNDRLEQILIQFFNRIYPASVVVIFLKIPIL